MGWTDFIAQEITGTREKLDFFFSSSRQKMKCTKHMNMCHNNISNTTAAGSDCSRSSDNTAGSF